MALLNTKFHISGQEDKSLDKGVLRMSKIKIAIAGCGSRGYHAYGKDFLTMADRVEIVAIAEPDSAKRARTQQAFSLTDSQCYTTAEELLQQERLADALVVATPDRQHVRQAIPALEKGYHLLLEKPISPELEDCQALVAVAEKTNRQVVVCHVLRYTPFFQKLKEILDSGVIGTVASLQAYEDVGYWHQAHSFVRGNWRNSKESSFMLLQKCCHDMDLYMWLLGTKANWVSSYGNLFHFHKENAPKGATTRCLDGCQSKEDCPFDAEKIYVTSPSTGVAHGKTGWPVNVVAVEPTLESVTLALRQGPYGRCVYHCDNDVVDHQVVSMELDSGASFSFTMSGLTAHGNRYAKFMGTKGEITADMKSNTITIMPFGKEEQVVNLTLAEEDIQGHGGGDMGIVSDFITLLEGKEPAHSRLTTLETSTESHYIAFAAEESRLHNGKSIKVDEYRI